MANRTSRKVKPSSVSRSSSTRSSQSSSSWSTKFNNNRALIAIVFVVVFAGLGFALLHKSYANVCVQNHYYASSNPSYNQCVADAQLMVLNAYLRSGWYSFNITYLGKYVNGKFVADGKFGYGTAYDVTGFQKSRSITLSGYDGSVGYYTWRKLCSENYQRWVYYNAGCDVVF